MGAHSNVFDAHMVPYLGAIFPVDAAGYNL